MSSCPVIKLGTEDGEETLNKESGRDVSLKKIQSYRRCRADLKLSDHKCHLKNNWTGPSSQCVELSHD